MTKRVKVEVSSIMVLGTPFGEGDSLEIYGHLGVWKIGRDFGGNPIDRGHFLGWDFQNDGSAVSIGMGLSLVINAMSPEFVIEADEELWVGGHLKDADDFDNDSLGDRYNHIRHDDLVSGRQRVRFDEGGQSAHADFMVTVL